MERLTNSVLGPIRIIAVVVFLVAPQVSLAAAVSSVAPTGNAYVDGMLTGTKWASLSQTFSAPADPSLYVAPYASNEQTLNFKAFTAAQLGAVRRTLAQHSAISNLVYTEVTESPTQSAVLRYAESDSPATAWGYYPSTSPVGGDSWYNNSSHYYDNPQKGNYANSIIMHETGHTVGFKHPHEASGSFAPMPADRDSVEYSVMSYHSYIGSGIGSYTIGSGSYPQSLQMYDVAAFQNDYGANFTTNAGNNTYKWSATTGEMFIDGVGQGAPVANKVFMTIWDGGGHDTYDASNYTSTTTIDLQPGHWTTLSSIQLSALGNGHSAAGNVANALLYKGNPASLIEDAVAGSGPDTILGNDADNALTGGASNDVIDGGLGSNTAVYSSVSTDYRVSQNVDGSWSVVDLRAGSPDGTDNLRNIQMLRFTDKTTTIGTTAPVNHAPVAANDSYALDMNTTLSTSTAVGVLANDTDQDGNALSAVIVSNPIHGTLTLNASGSFNYVPAAGYYGSDTFAYKASDGTLTSNIATVALTVLQVIAPDTTAPSTAVATPIPNAVLSGVVTTSATAADNVAVTQVQFYEDGALVATDTLSPYNWSWDTTKYGNGTHTLLSKAFDAAGNVGASAPVSVTVQNAIVAVDTAAPVTTIGSPLNGGTVPRGKVFNISATASDNIGVTKVVFYVSSTATCTVTTSPYTCGWRVPNSPNKKYTISTTAYDAAGNTGKSALITVTAK